MFVQKPEDNGHSKIFFSLYICTLLVDSILRVLHLFFKGSAHWISGFKKVHNKLGGLDIQPSVYLVLINH